MKKKIRICLLTSLILVIVIQMWPQIKRAPNPIRTSELKKCSGKSWRSFEARLVEIKGLRAEIIFCRMSVSF